MSLTFNGDGDLCNASVNHVLENDCIFSRYRNDLLRNGSAYQMVFGLNMLCVFIDTWSQHITDL